MDLFLVVNVCMHLCDESVCVGGWVGVAVAVAF